MPVPVMGLARGAGAVAFAVSALFATAGIAWQQSGHSTLPTTGATTAGAFPSAPREAEAVAVRIESLRRALGDLGKAYKKAPDRAQRESEVLAGLERAEAEIARLRGLFAGDGKAGTPRP